MTMDKYRLGHRPFWDLKFHGYSYLDVNQSGHGTSSTTNHIF